MLLPGLICSKLSLFLLFLQIFQIRGAMKIAIKVGIAATFITILPSIPIGSYFDTPRPGESWDELMLSGKPNKAIYWGIVQAVLGVILDAYMFVLPLPVISQLQLPHKRRLKLGLIFSTAFMFVIIVGPYTTCASLTHTTGASSQIWSTWCIVSRSGRPCRQMAPGICTLYC